MCHVVAVSIFSSSIIILVVIVIVDLWLSFSCKASKGSLVVGGRRGGGRGGGCFVASSLSYLFHFVHSLQSLLTDRIPQGSAVFNGFSIRHGPFSCFGSLTTALRIVERVFGTARLGQDPPRACWLLLLGLSGFSSCSLVGSGCQGIFPIVILLLVVSFVVVVVFG